MNLRETILDALNSKHDVECFDKLQSIRKKARERGIDDIGDKIAVVITEWREAKAKPVEPVTPEKPPEVKSEPIKHSNDSRKSTVIYEQPKQRKDSDSMILRMADERKGKC